MTKSPANHRQQDTQQTTFHQHLVKQSPKTGAT